MARTTLAPTRSPTSLDLLTFIRTPCSPLLLYLECAAFFFLTHKKGTDLMTQHQLNRQVARSTGERLSEIRRRGFSLLQAELNDQEDSLAPNLIHWDECGMPHSSSLCPQMGDDRFRQARKTA